MKVVHGCSEAREDGGGGVLSATGLPVYLLPLVIHELAAVLVMFPSELVLWVVAGGVSMYLLPPCSGLSSYGWHLCILTEN